MHLDTALYYATIFNVEETGSCIILKKSSQIPAARQCEQLRRSGRDVRDKSAMNSVCSSARGCGGASGS